MDRPEAFADALESTSNITVHRDYSGRSMYGASCIGVSFKAIGELLEAVYWLGRQDEHGEFQGDIANAEMDSLGRGSIVYWREMETMAAESDDEDDDEAEDEPA